MRLAAGIVAVALTAGTAGATPSQDFLDAKQKFSTGAYTESIAMIVPLLYPPPPKLETQREEAEAHLFLAVAYYEIGNFKKADEEWKVALSIDGNLTVEPPSFTEKQTEFFRERKEAYDRDLARENELRKYRDAIDNLRVIDRRNAVYNIIPLGIGQFQNGQTGKGLAFLFSQLAFGGASIGIWTFQGLRYGFRNGKVPPDELDTAETLQAIQIGTGVVFLGLVAWGIVDAFVYYQPTTSRKPTPDELPDLGTPAPDSKPATSFRLTPLIGPDYAGAGLSVEF